MTNDERRARDRARYAANPEYYQTKAREYGRRNKEARAEYSRAYRAADPERHAAQKAASRAAHPERAAAYAKGYRARHPELLKDQRRRGNLKKYGLTPQSHAVLLGKQEGLCAICADVLTPGRTTHVDHDHQTGAVRGLLCGHCNLVLGHARDNTRVLAAAIDYINVAARRGVRIA